MAEVREMLRSDEKYSVLSNMRALLQGSETTWPGGGPVNGNFGAPAVNVIHTDWSERQVLSNMPSWTALTEAKQALKANKYTVYHVNLWRNINPREPVRNFHLAVLDRSTLSKDLAQSDIYGFEQYGLRYSPEQRWVYFPQMQVDEILMFPQGKCTMEREAFGREWTYSPTGEELLQATLHTAVIDPSAPEAQRESCESRFLVFVPVFGPARSSL